MEGRYRCDSPARVQRDADRVLAGRRLQLQRRLKPDGAVLPATSADDPDIARRPGLAAGTGHEGVLLLADDDNQAAGFGSRLSADSGPADACSVMSWST